MPEPDFGKIATWLGGVVQRDYAVSVSEVPDDFWNLRDSFDKSLSVIDKVGEPSTAEEVTAWLKVSAILRESNPLRYFPRTNNEDLTILDQDIRNLASLVSNITSGTIPENQREYIPVLKKFLRRLAQAPRTQGTYDSS